MGKTDTEESRFWNEKSFRIEIKIAALNVRSAETNKISKNARDEEFLQESMNKIEMQ